MRIFTVLGARPQFVKAAAVSNAIRQVGDGLSELIVHTGQHYDANMSDIFFEELGIPKPAFHLGIGGGGHGAMTGRTLEAVENLLVAHRPDAVMVYGDTNATLAGALAAAKLHIPVVHVEAGLRSYNMRMPEEINRILTDRLSALLLCPSDVAARNLEKEGMTRGVEVVGDVMYDAVLHFKTKAAEQINLQQFGVAAGEYVVATVHRQENTDDVSRLRGIVSALAAIAREVPVILPAHPRLRKMLAHADLEGSLGGVRLIDPVGYLAMIRLQMSARAVLTDSGGVQKEAFFLRVPCITLRDQTEWVETVELGANRLCGADPEAIKAGWDGALRHPIEFDRLASPYGDGNAAKRITDLLRNATTLVPTA